MTDNDVRSAPRGNTKVFSAEGWRAEFVRLNGREPLMLEYATAFTRGEVSSLPKDPVKQKHRIAAYLLAGGAALFLFLIFLECIDEPKDFFAYFMYRPSEIVVFWVPVFALPAITIWLAFSSAKRTSLVKQTFASASMIAVLLLTSRALADSLQYLRLSTSSVIFFLLLWFLMLGLSIYNLFRLPTHEKQAQYRADPKHPPVADTPEHFENSVAFARDEAAASRPLLSGAKLSARLKRNKRCYLLAMANVIFIFILLLSPVFSERSNRYDENYISYVTEGFATLFAFYWPIPLTLTIVSLCASLLAVQRYSYTKILIASICGLLSALIILVPHVYWLMLLNGFGSDEPGEALGILLPGLPIALLFWTAVLGFFRVSDDPHTSHATAAAETS